MPLVPRGASPPKPKTFKVKDLSIVREDVEHPLREVCVKNVLGALYLKVAYLDGGTELIEPVDDNSVKLCIDGNCLYLTNDQLVENAMVCFFCQEESHSPLFTSLFVLETVYLFSWPRTY